MIKKEWKLYQRWDDDGYVKSIKNKACMILFHKLFFYIKDSPDHNYINLWGKSFFFNQIKKTKSIINNTSI